MNNNQVDVMNRLGRAMADSSRSRILLALMEQPCYPAQLSSELGLSRTNVSNHLACLRGCGLVRTEVQGRRTMYSLVDPHLAAALGQLLQATISVDEAKTCENPDCTVLGCCNEGAKL
ncbi:ArsR/SmtB family transcription factor [Boudabousia marimammalium]|uniref:Transcriptional regulator n=1 Tax=Boudabousia marimammalium TaxID=156892 RepID=A0A1Q5PL41_9ACTO|nr:metalloregulator ArsR/SmtB family transcription factor [Boudabousia marimammalium]OKL47347.1 transcriptional regulator [Boudabousia marimammalium]